MEKGEGENLFEGLDELGMKKTGPEAGTDGRSYGSPEVERSALLHFSPSVSNLSFGGKRRRGTIVRKIK